ncbi:predicted protein [Plenodomus lingam JN3]|uniref:Uncharacterized protein n=1 Tax=Leptosphaeria maculans (strain JN3 / isolate v23.1.3 / race Av1-4-5-6-7-8) TaxID=985895 RepID=E5A7I4_LEPMJ|nr:predicted protein [Plenodomus lingam JN3]CBX99579.1 predicted protein [Plenodomus lingam JN3]
MIKLHLATLRFIVILGLRSWRLWLWLVRKGDEGFRPRMFSQDEDVEFAATNGIIIALLPSDLRIRSGSLFVKWQTRSSAVAGSATKGSERYIYLPVWCFADAAQETLSLGRRQDFQATLVYMWQQPYHMYSKRKPTLPGRSEKCLHRQGNSQVKDLQQLTYLLTGANLICKDTELDVEAYPEGDMRVRPPHRLCNPSSMILVKQGLKHALSLSSVDYTHKTTTALLDRVASIATNTRVSLFRNAHASPCRDLHQLILLRLAVSWSGVDRSAPLP